MSETTAFATILHDTEARLAGPIDVLRWIRRIEMAADTARAMRPYLKSAD